MSPDDPRHATVAGYRKHFADKEPACRACKDAKNEYQRTRKRTNRAHRDVYFIESGYHPADGLGAGQWVPRPNSGGVMEWEAAS